MPALQDHKEAAPNDRSKDRQHAQANGPKREQPGEVVRAAPRAPSLWSSNPFAMMRRFAEEMDRLFAEYGFTHGLHMPSFVSRGRELLGREAGLVPAEWSPQIDILERGGQFVVRADLPGMTKEDVKVEVTDDMLTIQGQRRTEKEQKHQGYYVCERSYGSFYRSIPLPEGVDVNKANVSFRNGVLEVVMPAPERKANSARRLEIKE